MADVWMTWCRRKAKCHWCEEPITSQTPMVKVKIWRGKAMWRYTMYLHPFCWTEQGMAALDREGPFRGRLPLSSSQKANRFRLIRNWHNCKGRLYEAAVSGDVDEVIKLLANMEGIKQEIADYGGVPKKWLAREADQDS